MTQHMEADARSLLIKVWDLEARDGPVQMVMRSVNARDALKRDPNRYTLKLPKGIKPGPAQAEFERQAKEEADQFAAASARDPVFGNLGVEQ
jgi:hypothetical protein